MIQHKLVKTMVTKRRGVSFDESKNVLHINVAWSFEDSKNSWYNKSDFQRMKESCNTQAKQIWKRERRIKDENSYMQAILRVYDICCETPKEIDECVLSQTDKALLTVLIGKANTRTGLEKMCIRELANDKRNRRATLVDLVLKIQATHKAGSIQAYTELMRLSSESVSHASRRFARHMAQALAASLQ